MATYSIKWLKNLLGTKFFPITHVKAVRDDNNTNLETLLSGKQQTLVSGSNIKTINGESVLGSGNISVSGGGGGGDVNVIESISVNNTPQAVDANKNVNITVPSKVSDLSNDSGFITGYTETDPVFSASAAASINETDIDNWNSKTSNIGTITGITMNGSSKGTSGVVNLGTVITAHQDISGKADKSATVSSVDYNTTSKKITKTINGTTSDVVTAAKIVTDGGGITTETDPTVPSWAKESSKPSYTASEVGAVPTTRKVNGKALSADITLSASDVSALPSSTAIPSKTSDLTNDSGFLTSSDISGVYKYKGSKTNYSNLPTSGNVTGDVWNVVNAYGDYPAGTNFAWTGSAWDALGGAVDLSGYVPTSRTVNGKALSSNISLSASDVSALPSSTYIPTKTSDLTNDSDFITSADIPEGAAASSTTPLMDGTAAVGTETRFARGDHRHPSDTSKQDVISDLATIRSNASAGAAKVSNVQADWNASTGLAVILNKPTIPAEVTESTVAGWGFTKNTGTYSKPSTGIPKTDLASAVQTSLGLADTALQSFTESDPVFTASAAHGISSTDISNWNAKGTYSKPSGGIPKTDLASAVQTSLGKADTALQSYTETDPVFTASGVTLGTEQTITGKKTFSGTGLLTIHRPGSNNSPLMWFSAGDSPASKVAGFAASYAPNAGLLRVSADGSTTYKLWDQGNHGAGSGLDADLLDGQHADAFITNVGLNGDYLTTTKGGTVSDAIHILERGETKKLVGASSTGWYRIAQFINSAAHSNTVFLLLQRSYNNSNNEAYIFAITTMYSGKVSISQIAGTYNAQRISKIRVDNPNSGYGSIDIYYTASNGNDLFVTTIGSASVLSSAVLNPTTTGTLTEYTIVQGIGTTLDITASGNVNCTSVNQTSDEYKKKKVGDIDIKVEDIAAAPNLTFTWKNGEDTKNIHGGTYAQYWEKITPYYVHGEEGDKSLEYSPLAVSCSIQLAKEIVTLKEENTQLKEELAEIKKMVNKLNK